MANERADGGFVPTSHGVKVFAMDEMLFQANATTTATLQLAYIPEIYAGQQITISVFDYDQFDPLNETVSFYFDSFSRDAFEVNLSIPCENIGDCNDRWVGPPGGDFAPLVVTIPYSDRTELCTNASDPMQQYVCNSFTGGYLMMEFTSGELDTALWKITLPELPADS